jgi:hypothetical protein
VGDSDSDGSGVGDSDSDGSGEGSVGVGVGVGVGVMGPGVPSWPVGLDGLGAGPVPGRTEGRCGSVRGEVPGPGTATPPEDPGSPAAVRP